MYLLYLTKSPGNCERRDGSTLAIASEASQVLGNAVSGVWIESGTTADRIIRIEESAKHRVADSLSRLLRCTCQVYLPLRVLTPPPSFVIGAVEQLYVGQQPSAETMMCCLPSLSTYHRLTFRVNVKKRLLKRESISNFAV